MRTDNVPWFLTVVTAIVAIDRLTKMVASAFIPAGMSIDILPFFKLTYVTNVGISFGMLRGYPWIPFLAGVIVVGAIAWYFKKIPSNWMTQNGFALIMGGAIGNLWDRVVYGTVIDFLDFTVWPVFNIADSAITIGGVFVIYWMIFVHGKKDQPKNKKSK